MRSEGFLKISKLFLLFHSMHSYKPLQVPRGTQKQKANKKKSSESLDQIFFCPHRPKIRKNLGKDIKIVGALLIFNYRSN